MVDRTEDILKGMDVRWLIWGEGTMAFSAASPARIIAVNLDECGGRLICQRGSFLCFDKSVDTQIGFVKTFRAGFFGGTGFVLQEFIGSGYVFLNAGRVVTQLTLSSGESLRVTTGSLVAMEQSIGY